MISPHLVELGVEERLPAVLDAAGLSGGWPVLVVLGGASGLADDETRAREVIDQVAIPAAVLNKAVIVDGGTDSGVMRLVGASHSETGARTPLVGVAVSRLVRVPGRTSAVVAADAVDMEPHHTHLVLVPGTTWGDESPWLSAVATHLSAGRGAVSLVVNGGAVTVSDVWNSVTAGRPVIVAGGTGRYADLLAAAVRARRTASAGESDGPADRAVASGLVTTLDTDRPIAAQRDQLSRLLGPGRAAPPHRPA